MIKNKNIIITTGGTGGHIIPGISLSKYLISLKNNVYWIGTKEKMESHLVSKNNINIYFINIYNFKEENLIKKIIFPINLIKSIYQSYKIISYIKPDIIIGMGGYISLPVCIAGWIKNIPIMIHEQNSTIGLSNKFLYYISKKNISGFNLKNKKYKYVGNPLRESIINIPNPYTRLKNRKGPIRILIFGGSNGSNFINKNIPILISKLNNIIIWHISGYNDFNLVVDLYDKFTCKDKIYSINKFIYNMNNAYYWSDIIICRSGAMTISEILCISIPSIIIPLNNFDKHQYYNSLILKDINIIKIFNENNFNINLVHDYILNLNRNYLFKLSSEYYKKYNFNSVKKITNEIYKILNE